MAVSSIHTHKLAPRPGKRSFVRSTYDAVAAAGGSATVREVIELIPATDDADKWPHLTRAYVVDQMRVARAYGYLRQVNDQRWTIASYPYYEQRQAFKAAERAKLRGPTKKELKQLRDRQKQAKQVQQQLIQDEKYNIKECEYCGKPFRFVRSNQMFCSNSCSKRAWELRRREAIPLINRTVLWRVVWFVLGFAVGFGGGWFI